jgi:hypothetical protein
MATGALQAMKGACVDTKKAIVTPANMCQFLKQTGLVARFPSSPDFPAR